MKKYVLPIIAGFLCGLVASLPWLLVYMYGNMIVAILAIPIALGVEFGYRKLNGERNKKLPIIIAVITIVDIIILCSICIPAAIIAREGYPITIFNFRMLYSNSEFMRALLGDLVVSVAFGILGIGGVIGKIKREVDPESAKKMDDMVSKFESDKQKIIDCFIENSAINKESAISVDKINLVIESDKALKAAFNNLKITSIIRKYKGKYYYSEKSNKGQTFDGKSYLLGYDKVFGILMILLAAIFIINAIFK